jgi:hypothetical protein
MCACSGGVDGTTAAGGTTATNCDTVASSFLDPRCLEPCGAGIEAYGNADAADAAAYCAADSTPNRGAHTTDTTACDTGAVASSYLDPRCLEPCGADIGAHGAADAADAADAAAYCAADSTPNRDTHTTDTTARDAGAVAASSPGVRTSADSPANRLFRGRCLRPRAPNQRPDAREPVRGQQRRRLQRLPRLLPQLRCQRSRL